MWSNPGNGLVVQNISIKGANISKENEELLKYMDHF